MSEADMGKIDKERIIHLFQLEVKNERDFEDFMHYFYEMGFLLASYHIENPDTTTCRFTITLGEPFKWVQLDQGNLPDEIFLKTGFKKNIFQEEIFNFNRITKLFRSVIQYSERHGYPFAIIRLREIEIKDHRITASLDYQSGPVIYFANLIIRNAANLKSNFLAAYLNTRPGMPFDQRKVDQISYRVRQLAFTRLTAEPSLIFRKDSCDIYLDLETVRANSFDGILGFLPNENEPDKLLITGQLFLGLDNLFRSGKKFNVEWQKPNLLTQELQIQYEHPALFRLPTDLGFDFHLFKQDTSFINRDLHVFFFLNPGRMGSLGLNYTYMSSRLLSISDLQQIKELDKVDYDLNYYGLKYRLNTLDRMFFPTRGFLVDGSIQFGTKKIIRNVGIDAESYEGLQERTLQIRSTLAIDKYFGLFPKNTLLLRVSAGYIDNDQLFFNDLFRLGGLNSIRGFNERNFFASWYLTGTMEYRYLFENNSQLFFFFDGSGLGYSVQNQSLRDHPFGFGGGFSLSTRAGFLHIIYALGKSAGQPLGLNYSKIHIGYSNRF
jgi:outer membrane protein assembly factor BamA